MICKNHSAKLLVVTKKVMFLVHDLRISLCIVQVQCGILDGGIHSCGNTGGKAEEDDDCGLHDDRVSRDKFIVDPPVDNCTQDSPFVRSPLLFHLCFEVLGADSFILSLWSASWSLAALYTASFSSSSS